MNYRFVPKVYRVFDAAKRIRVVKAVDPTYLKVSINSLTKRPATIDTGAGEHCIKAANTFVSITEDYTSKDMMPDVELHQANGEVLEIEGKGNVYPNVVEDAYHTPSIEGDLVSGPRLQDKGCWIVLPPTSVSNDIGVIVANTEGKVIMLGDKDMTTDLNQINSHNTSIKLPDISNLIRPPKSSTKRNVSKVYGFPNAKVEDLVALMQKTFFCTKEEAIWMASGPIKNFPVTPEQIKKYWKEDSCYLRGHMQARKIDRNQYDSKEPSEEGTKKPSHQVSDESTWRNANTKKLETRNLVVGKEVGTDIFGPVLGASVVTFTDKATGYRISHPFQKDGKKEIPKILDFIVTHYRKFGHHSDEFRSPIDILKSDSESVYKSTFIKDVLDKHGITPIYSPPEQKQYNGLAESTHKIGGMKVSSMYACAPHVPEQKWLSAWNLADHISNMYRSNIPGSDKTRFEEFRDEKPDMTKIILLPYGQPIEYFIPKAVREGKFGAHSAIGIYEGPDLDIPGNIWVYGYKSKRSVSRNTYRILPHIPSSFVKIPLKYFVEKDESLETDTNPLFNVYAGATAREGHSEGAMHDNNLSVISTSDTVSLSENSLSVNNISDLPNLLLDAHPTPTVPTVLLDSNLPVPVPAEPTAQQVILPVSVPPPPQMPLSQADPLSTAPDQEGEDAQMRAVKTPEAINIYKGRLRVKVIHCRERLITSTAKITRKVAAKRRTFDNPSLAQAKLRSDWPQWKAAIDAELKQMEDEGVFRTGKRKKLPRDANVVGSMWVLQIKRDKSTGAIDKYKARLVALGNQQKDTSYKDIKSSTVRTSNVKLLIAIQAKSKAMSMVLDVKGAFLKSDVDKTKGENLWLRLPDGEVVELEKYLYGLKQAGYEWMKNLSYYLIQCGYAQCPDDPMLFSLQDGNNFIHMTIHVDDFYVVSNNETMMRDLKDLLDQQYGEVSIKEDNILTYLGMIITREEDTNDITITQPAYVEKLLQQVDLKSIKSVSTPMSIERSPVSKIRSKVRKVKSHAKHNKIVKAKQHVDKTHYLQLVGGLNYLVQLTRPDLSYALSSVAQKCSKPTHGDLQKVLRIFKYVELTKNYGTRFTCDDDYRVICHVDASFNCYIDGRGHYGYCFSLGEHSGAFFAKSSKMRLTTLSSTEAEYVALCEASKDAVVIRRMLMFLGCGKRSVRIYEDNKSCIEMARGNINHKVNKHIKPKYSYSAEQWKSRKTDIRYKKTTEMIADILTKALPTAQTIKLSELILNW